MLETVSWVRQRMSRQVVFRGYWGKGKAQTKRAEQCNASLKKIRAKRTKEGNQVEIWLWIQDGRAQVWWGKDRDYQMNKTREKTGSECPICFSLDLRVREGRRSEAREQIEQDGPWRTHVMGSKTHPPIYVSMYMAFSWFSKAEQLTHIFCLHRMASDRLGEYLHLHIR